MFRDVTDVTISTLVISPRKPPVAPLLLGGASLFVNRNLVRPRYYAAPNGECTQNAPNGWLRPLSLGVSLAVSNELASSSYAPFSHKTQGASQKNDDDGEQVGR